MGGGKKSKSKSKSKTKTKAQKMATANKAKYGGTGSAAKANSNRNKTSGVGPVSSGKAYASSLGNKKVTTKPKSSGTSGIGPVKSGSAYAKSLSTAKNQPSKKTSGVGPVASGKAYAAAVNSAKNAPTKKTSGVGPVASGAKYASMLSSAPKKSSPSYNDGQLVAMDNLGSKLAIGAMTGIVGGALGIKNKVQEAAENLRRINEQKMEGLGDQSSIYSGPGTLVSANNLTGLAPKSTRFESATGDDSFAQSLGINTDVGGVNYGGLNELRGGSPFVGNANTSRVIRPTGNPNVMSPDGTFNRPGPGGPEPESDYTSYQPGSPFNLSNVNMNATNAGRVLSNVVRAPLRFIGINNNLTDRLYMKDDEAIQDGIDQRGPRAAVARRPSGGGGARLPIAAPTPEEILLPEEVAPTEVPTYQQAGLDNNRLMQIQQEAYQQAYNPMTVGGFNPMFRFFGNRQGPRRGAFRRAFTRAA